MIIHSTSSRSGLFHLKTLGIFLAVALLGSIPSIGAEIPSQLDAFEPFLNKTWKGLVDSEKGVYDVARWERAIGGQAIRMVHSVGEGAYSGETIVMWDRPREELVYYYFTSAGFYTHGTMSFDDTGRLSSHEKVEGNEAGVTEVRASQDLLEDGRMRVQTRMLRNGKWEDRGEVLYIVDPKASLYDVVQAVDHQAAIVEREADDARLASAADEAGMVFRKATVQSRTDGLSVPLYLFEPADGAAKKSLVWIYGGIHDRFGVNYFPFIREAVDRSWRVVVPEYRGAIGYGADFYNAMDYGGLEVDDALAAADWVAKNDTPVSIIGWSHGGLIALLAAARDDDRFHHVVASVPVTNLVMRMSYKGPEYHRVFIDQPGFGGPVHERLQSYLDRSPLFQVDRLKSRIMVQLATNDDDVAFIESEPLAHALRQTLKDRAEVIVFKDPPHGHFFNRQVDLETLTRRDTPEQTRSWQAIWRFLDSP